MNNLRRKELSDLIMRIEYAKSDLENILSDEQDYFDNIPENMQGGEKGSMSEQAISCMEEAISNIDEAIDQINSASE